MLRQYLALPIYESGEGLVKVIMCSDILDVRKYATRPTWLASSLIPSGYGKHLLQSYSSIPQGWGQWKTMTCTLCAASVFKES